MLTQININFIVQNNIKRKLIRSFSMILLIFILSFSVFSSIYLVTSLKYGMESLSNRLGADLIIVPKGYDESMEGVLLKGEPSDFYFERAIMDKIKNVEGIESLSEQLFISTISAGCCSFPLQCIGINMDTDFLIKPWLNENLTKSLGNGEIIVGYNIMAEIGDELTFFNKNYRVKGKLDNTGMGFDNTIFMPMNQAIGMADDASEILKHPVSKDKNLISNIMIKIKKDANLFDTSFELRQILRDEDVQVIESFNLISDISGGINKLYIYMYSLIGLIWILVLIVISLVFNSIFNERKRELGSLRVIGASKKYLIKLCVLESFYISSLGAILGLIFGNVIMMLFNNAIVKAIDMPFLRPRFVSVLLISGLVFVFISFIGPLASIYSIRNINKKELALIINNND